jgi:hypothetical protein
MPMPDRTPPPDPEDAGALHPWSTPQAEELEPDWAEEIRERRKARGDRLKEIFDGFGDGSGTEPPPPKEPPARKDPPA